jgi:hypothetical protein
MSHVNPTSGRKRLGRKQFGAILFFALAFSGIGAAQSKDPLVGHWTLNRGKSEFNPDTTLQSREITFEAKDGGISFVQKTVTDRGNTVESDYTAKYDSTDAPITGSQMDTVSLKKVNATTVQRSGKIKGKLVETLTMTISGDGKVLTLVTKGTIDGDDYSSTQVYEKQ